MHNEGTMEIPTGIPLDDHQVFRLLCAATGKWGLLITFDAYDKDIPEGQNYQETIKASGGYLDYERDGAVLHYGYGIFLFDDEEAMRYCV